MRSQIAVRRAKHIKEVTSTRAERLSHADVVFEDLARRGGHVCWTVEEMLDDVVSQRRQTRI